MRKPVFAKPPCIVRFCSKKEYFAFLRKYHIPYETWSKESRLKAWKEVKECDAVYSLDNVHGSVSIPVRCIIVITARVVIDHPTLGRLALTEFVRKGNRYKPRRQEIRPLLTEKRRRQQIGSSLSEKAVLYPDTGQPLETPAETLARCLWQETEIFVPRKELNEDNLLFEPEESRKDDLKYISQEFGEGARDVELDDEPTKKYPGLPTFRQVARFNLTLPAYHYRKEGHQDAATKYFSFWRSVHEKGSVDPLPVDQVLRMRKASA